MCKDEIIVYDWQAGHWPKGIYNQDKDANRQAEYDQFERTFIVLRLNSYEGRHNYCHRGDDWSITLSNYRKNQHTRQAAEDYNQPTETHPAAQEN